MSKKIPNKPAIRIKELVQGAEQKERERERERERDTGALSGVACSIAFFVHCFRL